MCNQTVAMIRQPSPWGRVSRSGAFVSRSATGEGSLPAFEGKPKNGSNGKWFGI